MGEFNLQETRNKIIHKQFLTGPQNGKGGIIKKIQSSFLYHLPKHLGSCWYNPFAKFSFFFLLMIVTRRYCLCNDCSLFYLHNIKLSLKTKLSTQMVVSLFKSVLVSSSESEMFLRSSKSNVKRSSVACVESGKGGHFRFDP